MLQSCIVSEMPSSSREQHLYITLPIAVFTVGVTAYLLINDRRRRREISSRQQQFGTLSTQRYSSLKLGGRFQNPFPEWREQGAWEWAVWQLTGKWFNDHGLPKDETILIKTLPAVSPQFDLLFPASALQSAIDSPTTATPPSEMSESWTNVSQAASVQSLAEHDMSGEKTPLGHSLVQTRPPLHANFTYTWIGQSTSFIQMEGLNILTDPVFADRPVDWVGPKRLRPTPCRLEDLKRIDIVLVSHNHFDHLDIAVVDKLRNSVTWYVPVGMRQWFARQGVHRIVELDWWQETNVREAPHIKIACTPAMHWSARTPLDTNRTLWCSFVVKGIKDTFFHCGDTGYCGVFKEIGAKYGPIDLAAIPIGSYEPEWHLGIQHVGPREAIKIHLDIKAKKSIGVHWGTWIMSEERYNEPPELLAAERKLASVGDDEFCVVKFGETLLLRNDTAV